MYENNFTSFSFRLAHKLFEHPKVLEMMRLHSKTFAKMNVAILAILILAGFCAVLNMSNIEYAYRYSESIVNKTDVNPCQTVEVHYKGVHIQTYSFLEISRKKVKISPHLQFPRNFQKFPQTYQKI